MLGIWLHWKLAEKSGTQPRLCLMGCTEGNHGRLTQMFHKDRREMSSGHSSLFNDKSHNGAFCLMCAYLWHIKHHDGGFYFLLLFLRGRPRLRCNTRGVSAGQPKYSEGSRKMGWCMKNIWLWKLQMETKMCILTQMNCFLLRIWKDNDRVHGSSLPSARRIIQGFWFPLNFVHTETTFTWADSWYIQTVITGRGQWNIQTWLLHKQVLPA